LIPIMKLSLALLALVAAADTGYGDDAVQQAPEAQYEPEEVVGEPQYEPMGVASNEAFICRQPCPAHSPCLDKVTGTCATKIEAYGATNEKPMCPEGTKDAEHLYVRKTWPFWVGFGLLFAPALWFLCITIGDVLDNGVLDGSNQEHSKADQLHKLVAGFILLVASLAYFAMATRNGFIVRCGDGRSFYYARYIDWLITTPLILWELTHIAEHAHGVKDLFSLELYYLIFLDILMIVSGLIASLITSNLKWVFFAFSVLTFIPILKQICEFDLLKLKKDLNDSVVHTAGLYKRLMELTVVAWFIYPIVWILAEGTGTLSAYGESIFYMVLDVIAKSVFGVIVLNQMRPHLPLPHHGKK